MKKPDVSVVVCTRNRAHMLVDALESLAALEAENFRYEILVVDNASTDETVEVVAATAERQDVPIRCVTEPRPGIAFARNRGVDEARGEWIAFFDDDQRAAENWLVQLLAMADQKNVRCVGGAVHLQLPEDHQRDLSPVCRMLLGETVGMDAERKYSANVTPGTGNLLLHRSLFKEVGRFDESFNERSEDTDLFLRIHSSGIESWYTPAAVVFHVIPSERLSNEYLMKMSQLMVPGMAESERNNWGGLVYPVVWFARVVQALLMLVPRLLWARLIDDKERVLGACCRLSIARGYLRDGLRIMFTTPCCRLKSHS